MDIAVAAQVLIEAAARDLKLREQLAQSGALWLHGYHPDMEAVHQENAALLKHVLFQHGWPDAARFGEDAAEAAWLIAQHAIGDPPLQRQALTALQQTGDTEPWRAAMLGDRIACFEGRGQRYGTQHDWDEFGELSPLPIDDPAGVDERRAAMGLEPLAERTAKLRERAVREGETPPVDPVSRRLEAEAWARRTGWR